METEVKKLERMRINAFADKHGLTMQVVERSKEFYCGSSDFEANRWYACFKNVEIIEPGDRFLVSAHGNGHTPAAAVADYARRISEKKLVFGAFTPERREIYAPVLTR